MHLFDKVLFKIGQRLVITVGGVWVGLFLAVERASASSSSRNIVPLDVRKLAKSCRCAHRCSPSVPPGLNHLAHRHGFADIVIRRTVADRLRTRSITGSMTVIDVLDTRGFGIFQRTDHQFTGGIGHRVLAPLPRSTVGCRRKSGWIPTESRCATVVRRPGWPN